MGRLSTAADSAQEIGVVQGVLPHGVFRNVCLRAMLGVVGCTFNSGRRRIDVCGAKFFSHRAACVVLLRLEAH